MNNPKEMPAPCKDEQAQNKHYNGSKVLPLSQVGSFQPIGEIAARLVSQISQEKRNRGGKCGVPGGALFPSREHPSKPSPQVCVYPISQAQSTSSIGGAHA